jgi:hypothetical protein
MGGRVPCNKDLGVAPGPEVPWDVGSGRRANTTVELGSDVLGSFTLGSYTADSSTTTRSGMKPMGRRGGGDKFTGDDDHAVDKLTSLLTRMPSSMPFFGTVTLGWYSLHLSHWPQMTRYEQYVHIHMD